MRRALLVVALAAGLTAAGLPGAGPAGAQLSLLGLQNSLVQFALARISTPDSFEITAEGVQEDEDGRTELFGVRIADGAGVWLEIDGMGLSWSPTRILRGELAINRLAARGVRVLRRPEPAGVAIEATAEPAPREPFAWPRAPITTRIDELRLDGVSVAGGVIAAQSLAFDALGAARDEGAEQAATLTLTRTDAVAGEIALDYLRDFRAGTLRLNLTAQEAAGGLVGELAGFPPDSASRVRVAADGPLDDWSLTFAAEAEQVVTADGRARVVVGPPLAVDAAVTVRPGPAMAPEIAAALAPEAQLVARAAEDADGVIRIEEGAIRSPQLTLDADGFFARADGALGLTVALEARAGLAALVEGVDFDRIAFDGAVDGALDALRARGAVALDGLSTGPADVGAARLQADVTVAGSDIGFDVAGSVDGLRLDRIPAETLGRAELTAQGAWDGAAATLDVLRLTAPLLRLEASGRADVAGDAAALAYGLSTPDLRPIAAAYDVDAGGAVAVEGRLDGPLSAPRLVGTAALQEIVFEGEPYGRVALRHDVTIGPEPAGRVALEADGSRFGPAEVATDFRLADEVLTLRALSATALGARATGDLAVRLADGLADGGLTARLEDLGPLSDLAGAPVAGSADLTVTLRAADGAQDATVRGRVADFAGFDAAARAIELDLELRDALGPGARAQGFAALEGLSAAGAQLETARFEGAARDLRGAPAVEGVLTAAGIAAAGARLATLRLEGRGENLIEDPAVDATLSATGLAAADATVGALNLRAQGRALRSAPEATVSATAERVALDATLSQQAGAARLVAALRTEPARGQGLALGALRLDATVTDALGADPVMDARATLGPSDLGVARLASLTASARGPLAAIEAGLDATGELGADPLRLAARARIDAAAAEPEATVTLLEAALGAAEARLRRPLRVTVGEAVALRGIDLALPGGALTGEANLHPDGASGDLALRMDDLAPLAALANAPVQAGALDARARFDTRAGVARATIEARGRGLELTEAAAQLGGLDLDADARWNGVRAAATAAVTGSFAEPLRLEIALPLRPGGGALPAVPRGAPLDGRITWRGRIGDLWALVPGSDNVLDGELDVDLGFAGPVAAPRLSGGIALRDGRYENLETGTILTNLTATSQAAPDGAFTLDLRADDGAGAPVTATARYAPGAVEARLDTTGAVLVRRDDVTARISAAITLGGPLDALRLAGDVTVDGAEVRLVNTTPPSVADLGPVRIKGAPVATPQPAAGEALALDLRVRAPGRIFVRGRGLDSEWGMNLDVTGTAATPVVVGAIERIRGQLSLVGATFRLERGAIRFTGGQPIDPALDVAILRDNEGVTGGIVVRGFASDPQISFESQPSLPESEVLPRVLFGKSQQSLDAGEALQLASGLATLLDGSGGVLDQVRATAGVDVLRLEGVGEDATVTVGQNVAPGVFVGAKQPLDGGAPRVTVEIEVLRNLLVDTEIGREDGSSVGLSWRRDF